MSAPVKGTAQIAREVIAEAVEATTAARTETSSVASEVASGVARLESGFKQIDPSIVLDIQLDPRGTQGVTNGLILANDHASLFVPIQHGGRAWRLDRSGLGKIEIVIPTKTEDAVERLIAALGSVADDFNDWSRAAANRNGRVRQ